MSIFKKMTDFSVNRVRSFSAFDMGLFKLTMFFLGMLFAVNMPRFSKRGKGLIAAVTAILTGTFLGYFFFGERYFELDHDGEAVTVKKGA
ncbi:hypothetical protein SDC9_90876 [bioreactor metagenome]|uniref:Uncharacterized protein n=1 Tax=bioreactor metagenome TaxID=1076179 RepID=A0A644ZUV3_9ZZZZ